MNTRRTYAGSKIPQVTSKMGIKGISNMQGTTRIIYDSIKLATTTTISAIQFFENVNTRKFPFSNIPIADFLIQSVAKPIKHLGLEFEYTTRVMNDEERNLFLQLETEAWKG